MKSRHVLALLLPAIGVASGCNVGSAPATVVSITETARASPLPHSSLVVTSVIQSSSGVTAEHIDQEFTTWLEEHFAQESKRQYAIAMKNIGREGETVEHEIGTVFFNEGGERLAVTTIKTGEGGAISKIAWWISNGEIRRAVCVDMAGNEVPIRTGACAAKIAEVFGYANWTLD